MTGTNITITQSPDNFGLNVVEGSATLDGGSIDHSQQVGASIGAIIYDGTLTLNDVDVTVSGGVDTSGIEARGENAVIVADNLTITAATSGSTSPSPTAGVKTNQGAILISNSEIDVSGERGHGLLSAANDGNTTSIQSDANIITTTGDYGYGAYAFADDANTDNNATLGISGGSITTEGNNAYGLISYGERALLETSNGLTISTSGTDAYGAYAYTGVMNLTDTAIATSGLRGYGVYALDGGVVTITGGSIKTLSEIGRGTQNGDGSRAYALWASGETSSISAQGTSIQTLGQRAYGAYATGGAQIDLTDVTISTEGFMGYGVYASGAGSVIDATNVSVETTGEVGNAAWAYNGGVLNLTGGSYIARGEQNPNFPNEKAQGLVAVGGGGTGTTAGVINASGVTVATYGANSHALQVGSSIGEDLTYGIMNFTNGSRIDAYGANAAAAKVELGSTLTSQNSTFTSAQGVGIALEDDATVVLTGTTISAAKETFTSTLARAGQEQTISFLNGSVATENNGTLLLVNRTDEGADGVVILTLGAGSTSLGDILDEDSRTTGYTDVVLEEGVEWKGVMRGVRNIVGNVSGDVVYEDYAVIEGDVSANGASFAFTSEGASIGGDFTLNGGSSTSGGSIALPIIVGGDVTIDATSFMGGNWQIFGDLGSAGIVAPGNSIGRVSIAGDLALTPTSVYVAEIDATGGADLIEVGGTATLDGAVEVKPLGGFLTGQPYTILTAGTRSGTFDSVSFSGDYAFLTASLAYDPNNVYVTILRNNVAFSSFAKTPNQAAAASGLDTLPLTNAIAQTILLSTSTTGLAASFDQLSGEAHASLRTGLINDSRHLRDAVNGRMAATSLGESLTASSAGTAGIWGSGFGSWSRTDGNGNAASMNSSFGGMLLGADMMVGDAARIGLFGGYSRSDYKVDARTSSTKADSYHLGVYGGTTMAGLNLRAGAAYSWHNLKSSRTVAFTGFSDSLSADYDASTAQVFGELGYTLGFATAALEPFVNVAYVHLDTESFTESGGAAALSASERKSDTTFATAGLRASKAFSISGTPMTLNGMLGWRHAFGDRLPRADLSFAGSTPFAVRGVAVDKNAAVAEMGLGVQLTPMASLNVNYVGKFGNDITDNGLRGTLSLRF